MYLNSLYIAMSKNLKPMITVDLSYFKNIQPLLADYSFGGFSLVPWTTGAFFVGRGFKIL